MEERRSFVWRSHDSKRALELGARRQRELGFRDCQKLSNRLFTDNSRLKYEFNGKPSSASPAYAEIVVIGHGETEWNADGRIQLGICRLLDFLEYWILILTGIEISVDDQEICKTLAYGVQVLPIKLILLSISILRGMIVFL
ncbi:hypothetical protein LguiB_009231 [Lonicera macranthoides]